MTRNEAREIMMQILYEMEAANEMNEETVQRLAGERLGGVGGACPGSGSGTVSGDRRRVEHRAGAGRRRGWITPFSWRC